MRVLRLPVDGRRAVDLHPALSVVTGLDAPRAARVRRAVAAVATGLAPEGGGLLEAHGLLLDADQDDLDLLDLGADPRPGVATVATLCRLDAADLDGPDLDEPDADGERTRLARLRTAERDVLLLATDRRWAVAALVAARSRAGAGERDLARAEHLRLAVARHEATDVEPLRGALDADRDARRRDPGDESAVPAVADALAALGVDLRPHGVEGDEVRRIAEDLLDEHRRRAGWVVGARVELDGIERRLLAAHDAGPGGRPVLPESVERRAARASLALADAIARADSRRDEVRDEPVEGPATDVDELGSALVRTLGARDRDHPAGTAPLVLDRVLAGLADADVTALLDRIRPLTRGVQVLVLDDHPAAVAWAAAAGTPVAAVVRATPAPPAGTHLRCDRRRPSGGPTA